jgi:hypothetical protein
MIEYPYFADLVGSSVKSMFGAMIKETEHKATFNNMVDAKVKLNKDIYEASKAWMESMQDVAKKTTNTNWVDLWNKSLYK